MPPGLSHSWAYSGLRPAEVRGKLSGVVWPRYEQEPQPGAPDYLTLPTRPGLDTLGLIPCFWLEAEKLLRFCCQHFFTGLLLADILSSWCRDTAWSH